MGWRRIGPLAAAAVIMAACSSAGRPAGVLDEDSALAVIEAAYELFNSGQGEAWSEVRIRGSYFASDEDRQEILDYELDRVRPQIEAGARYEGTECASQGLGEWPVSDRGAVAGYYFICETELAADSDDFPGHSETFQWVVSEGPDGMVVAVRSDS